MYAQRLPQRRWQLVAHASIATSQSVVSFAVSRHAPLWAHLPSTWYAVLPQKPGREDESQCSAASSRRQDLITAVGAVVELTERNATAPTPLYHRTSTPGSAEARSS